MNNVILRGFASFLISLMMLTSQGVALAEDGGDVVVPEQPQVNSDAEGYNSETGAYSLIKRVDVSNSDFLTEVSTLSVTFLGADMAIDCQGMNYDMWAYLGASVGYLGLLILANKKLEDAQNQSLVNLSGNKESDLEVLNTMREGENNRLEATRLKFTAHTVMTVGFLVADILAWIEYVTEIYPYMGVGSQMAPTCTPSASGVSYAAKAVLSFITSMAGGGGLLTTAISLATMFFKQTTNSYIQRTLPRAIYYAVATGIAGASMIHTGNKKSQIKDNIDDLDVMIASYRATAPRDTIVPGGGANGGDNWGSHFTDLTVPATPGSVEDPGTTAMRGLNNIEIQDLRIPAGVNSPTLADSVAGLNTINRAMRSGRYGAAVAAAEGLEKNIAKLKKFRDDIKLKVNEKRKKTGKPPIDFAAKSQSLAEKLNKASGNAAQQAGVTNTLSKKEEPKSEEAKTTGGSQQAAEVAVTQAPEQIEDDIFEEGFDEDMMEVASLNPAQDLNDYVVNKKDIHNDRTKSIFSLLSVRYLKTAYPQLLEEAK